MSKRDEFVTIIRTLRAASPTITDKQRIGLLQQASQNYGLSAQDAAEILKDFNLVVGEEINYFDVLGFSIEDIQSLNEDAIVNLVEAAHKKRYRASLNAGGRIRPDGKTEEQWRTILNQARDTLKDTQKRRTHIATLETELISTAESLSPEPMASNTSVHDEMALISAGEFQMGSNDNDTEAHEKPVHTVYIDAFYIDKYPVTNAQYKKFVDANPPWSKPQWFKNRISRRYHDGDYLRHWTEDDYPDGKADYPVNWVSWYAAMAYAQWAGKRLPTEAEWEKAARGGLTNQKYPWGNSIDASKANFGKNIGETTSVGKYPANGYGLYDMVGNLFEWCLDKWDNDFYASASPNNPVSGSSIVSIIDNFTNSKESRVVRGGSWHTPAQDLRVAKRNMDTPKLTTPIIGFRCVMDVIL
ncbi:formylglycine-generating enzyme family protein [Candidatus Poribacteria bacterium]|nr:formylglycine-generating enzyme family protein [Candidatus Poribacteria bacterium]